MPCGAGLFGRAGRRGLNAKWTLEGRESLQLVELKLFRVVVCGVEAGERTNAKRCVVWRGAGERDGSQSQSSATD